MGTKIKINEDTIQKNSQGIYVASSKNYDGIYYSADGKFWIQSNVTNGSFYTIECNSQDIFVAANAWYGDGIYYSADGKDWKKSNITKGSFWTSVCNSQDIFVACSWDDDEEKFYSADGKDWVKKIK